ncbi:MAG: preprotein translocase subunit SecA [Blastochloris viridis]|uniref:Protein translocase subunit SecA n=1 Tax=Blastochloris viridis TaxID=1079 RepID=A0A6N4RFC2_BLAVI|nr:MAG: preprotein translocase subunit SecA [Blastochloris viridis]
MLNFVSSLFGTPSTRFLKEMQPYLPKIAALEAEMQAKTDEQLAAVTAELRAQLDQGAKLDSLIPQAFAAVREGAKRALGLRAFDVQILGGLSLHFGKIAEMKTGEGKTLVATFAAYLNALSGKGVHVVTVNDYLAKRDAAWMGQVFTQLGMTTAAIYHGQSPDERKEAYAADVTYATNNELGFDYLRDHMVLSPQQLVQRPLHYAIVDEVDSILIDEARTPLIISGPSDDKTDLYIAINDLIPSLKHGEDYELDEKQRSAHLTEEGTDKAEAFLRAKSLLNEDDNLYDVHNISLVHHVNQALRAHTLFHKDAEYIVKDGEVVLIDEFTGRMMAGRRLSDGLHQAIEAKEGVDIKQENQTLASITFQNYFRLYEKLSGMTGTAATEAEEFENIYRLPVMVIPTNNPVQRKDFADIIYPSRKGKMKAIVKDIQESQQKGQPVLVGTTTIERSEELSAALTAAGIKHNVLNARYHEQEAGIISQAGRKGAVTIATNMAGRGTDIKLGGNIDLLLAEAKDEADAERIRAAYKKEHEEVMAAGGLKVLGTERHESRRIDNQLRGRSGRQGDVGASVFYLSMQDDLIKRFVPNIEGLLARLNVPEDDAVQMGIVSKSIENAQNKIEALNFDLRKNILKYDEVLNDQRKVVYDQRTTILFSEDLNETILDFRAEILDSLLQKAFPQGALPEQWQPDVLTEGLSRIFNLTLPVEQWLKDADVGAESIAEHCHKAVEESWKQRTEPFQPHVLNSIEKSVLLQTLDRLWRQHLQALDMLRKGIGLRGYAQKDPLNEYARESYMLFEDLLAATKQETVSILSRVQLVEDAPEPQGLTAQPTEMSGPSEQGPITQDVPASQQAGGITPQAFGVASWDDLNPLDGRIPRNAPCPCGSGERFKACHGSVARIKSVSRAA